MTSRLRLRGILRVGLAASLAASTACVPASRGAGSVLQTSRRELSAAPALPHRDLVVEADGARLRGWIFPAPDAARPAAVVVYLHGLGSNRASGTWSAERLTARGLTVVTYDGRAHGESTGAVCTYGVREKADLARVLDAVGARRAVVVGVSLGAAVAIQAAAEDPRIIAVVSVGTFSDLDTIVRDRAPFFASEADIRTAYRRIRRQAGFDVADASPLRAAPRVHVPVLLVHGAADTETRPVHSERIFAALAGPRELLLVPGAGHGDALGRAWPQIEPWIVAQAGASATR